MRYSKETYAKRLRKDLPLYHLWSKRCTRRLWSFVDQFVCQSHNMMCLYSLAAYDILIWLKCLHYHSSGCPSVPGSTGSWSLYHTVSISFQYFGKSIPTINQLSIGNYSYKVRIVLLFIQTNCKHNKDNHITSCSYSQSIISLFVSVAVSLLAFSSNLLRSTVTRFYLEPFPSAVTNQIMFWEFLLGVNSTGQVYIIF